MKVTHLVCELLENPLGLETKTPRLSWRDEDSTIGAHQTAYRIVASRCPCALAKGVYDLWDTGRVESAETLDVVWAGKRLDFGDEAHWQVMVWDADGKPSAWSAPARFSLGLFGKDQLKAAWIGSDVDRSHGGTDECVAKAEDNGGRLFRCVKVPSDAKPKPESFVSPRLRKLFTLKAAVKRARLHVSAMGVMELFVNGKKASPDVFAPGWTDYRKRLELVTYDVTELLAEGANVLAAELGDGWWSGNLAWDGMRCFGGKSIGLFAQLEIDLADGTHETIVSDKTWQLNERGPVTFADNYDGEEYDARRESADWSTPRAAARASKDWTAAVELPAPPVALSARLNAAIREQCVVAAKTVKPAPDGNGKAWIFDLGQNMVGHERVTMRGLKRGARIRIRFAEMLNDDGTMYTANYRSARSTDYYTAKGADVEVYQPHYTFHGFRYVEVTGLAKAPALEDVVGVVLHTQMERTGAFECDDALANRLYSNLNWGQVGNYLDVPTDCPQRNERLGWTGDAQVFVRTGAYNRDVGAFFEKWQRDLDDSQKADGAYTDVAPDILLGGGHCGWGDAGIVCAWTMYTMYGDTEILRRSYANMARWVKFWADNATDEGIISTKLWHYGDWLAVDCPVNEWGNPDCGAAPTPSEMISTAYWARCADMMSQIADVLGKKADAKKYAAMFDKVAANWRRKYVTSGGLVASDTQTAYLMALGFNLVTEPAMAKKLLDRLVWKIESRWNKLTTGFLGTPLLCPVLTRFGRADVAYRLFHQKDYPSWNYPIISGDATTMWERWNSYVKGKGFGDVGMNSFNHYAYGAIGEWMYDTILGITPAAAGFRKILLKPTPGGNLTKAKGSYMTRLGKVSMEWKLTNKKGGITLKFTIPPNAMATLRLPGQKDVEYPAGTYVVKTTVTIAK